MEIKKNTRQAQFMAKVRAALGHPPHKKRGWAVLGVNECTDQQDELLARIRSRTVQEKKSLLNDLIRESRMLNLNVNAVKDARSATDDIIDIIQQKQPERLQAKRVVAWKHPLIMNLDLESALKKHDINIPVHYPHRTGRFQNGMPANSDRQTDRDHMAGAFIGLTSADFCLAETATLVMKTHPGQARAVSLMPSIHIAVIEIDRIIANLAELYAIIGHDDAGPEGLTNCLTFITGPSKTADIEAVMVHGAHGPRELYLFVITGAIDQN